MGCRIVLFFLLLGLSGVPNLVRAEEKAAPPTTRSEEELWQAVERHYQEEIDKLTGPEGEFTKRRAGAEKRISYLQDEVRAEEQDLEILKEKIAKRRTLISRVSTARLFGISGYIAFVVLIVHLLVYLYRTPEPPLPFHSAILVAIAILILFSLPAFGEEKLDESLSDANLLLSATPAEKALYWVEHLEGSGTLPAEISVRDPLLVPYQDLEKGSAEYQFTRAALLFETGSREGAIEALLKLPAARPQGLRADDLYSRAIRFLAREKAEALDEIGRVLIPRIASSVVLAELAVSLEQTAHDKLSELTTARVLEGTRSAPELGALADQAYNLGGPKTGHRLAEVALERARTSEEAIALARLLLKPGRDATLARKAVSEAIAKAVALKELGETIEVCLGLQEYPLATRAAEAAIERFGKSVATFSVPDPRLIYQGVDQAGENWISLAVLLGILNEKLDVSAGAKPAYDHAARLELDRILNVAAFEFPANLRSLFYVERFWRKQGDEEHLRLLRPVYEKVQEQELQPVLEKIRADEEETLKRLGAETAPLEKKSATLTAQLEAAPAVLARANRMLWLWIAHLTGVALAAFLVLWGCVVQARNRVKKLSDSALPGALPCFVAEGIGWVLTLSVIGTWVGLPLVPLSANEGETVGG
jgi:hypothetical protein